MDDLRVESYAEEDVIAKKRAASKRAIVAGGAIVLALGMFSLVGCVNDEECDGGQACRCDEHLFVVGGSGSWFVSVLERI